MSLDISVNPPRQSVRLSAGGALDSLPLAVLAGGALALAMTVGKAIAVWRTGIFYGPDDAMRAVEVRDFLAGQGWFDLVPRRLSPGHPFAMHWSRLADLPLAVAMLALRQLTDAQSAERLTRLIEPIGFYLLFLTVLAALARDLCGRGGAWAATLLAAGALDIIGDFMPGRIHHHALQILLLTLMAKHLSDGLDPARPNRMASAGAIAALSLAINLQNMPFVAMAAAIVGLIWAGQGPSLARGLIRFGLGLTGGAALVFVAQVPPDHYGLATCDAFGAPHLLAASVGGLSFVGLGSLSNRLRGVPQRCAALGAAALVTLAILKAIYPACLGDPYAGVDPVIRQGWMAEVAEAMPLRQLLARDPFGTLPIVVALLLGAGAIGAALSTERGLARSRWLVLAGLAATAIAGTFWQIRVAASAEVFSILGGAWLLCRLFATDGPRRRYGALLAVVTGLALTPAGWTAAAILVEPDPARPKAGSTALDPLDIVRCFEPESYDDLVRLPTGLVLSTIDPGAHILAYTSHSVFAAPYHRDTDGIRLSLEVFAAPPEAARAPVLASGATYIALCTASVEVHDLVRQRPDGLAAQILSGRLPLWLKRLDSRGPFRLYKVTGPA